MTATVTEPTAEVLEALLDSYRPGCDAYRDYVKCARPYHVHIIATCSECGPMELHLCLTCFVHLVSGRARCTQKPYPHCGNMVTSWTVL